MPIRNYTSKVPASQTAGAIQDLLGRSGASRVSLDYEGGRIVAVAFVMMVEARPVWFRIEPDVEGMLRAMKADKEVPRSRCNEEQAARTSWKNKFDWLDAQLAEVAAGQARIEQLLLGFAITDSGETLFARLGREGVLLGGDNPPLQLPE